MMESNIDIDDQDKLKEIETIFNDFHHENKRLGNHGKSRISIMVHKIIMYRKQNIFQDNEYSSIPIKIKGRKGW